MEEFISRIKKLGPNDVVSGDTFNVAISQMQHNIELLYRHQRSSVNNWNISDLLFGNIMDFDQTGQKRFVNGGRMDALEKTLAFTANVGTLSYEEFETLNNDTWLRWAVPTGSVNNVTLRRNIAVPEAIRSQNLLIGAKFVPFVGNNVKEDERYEIYVNGVYCGTGETGIHKVNGVNEAKTIYGVYHMTGTETSLDIQIQRSVTNAETEDGYVVRLESMYVGLHTLGNDSFTMNFPVSGSSFIGAGADIEAFYDFENNAVRPIPSFLINNQHLAGGGSQTVNISAFAPTRQSNFYVGLSGTGNELGTSSVDVMSIDTFMDQDYLPSSVNIYLQEGDYGSYTFDAGSYDIYLDSATSLLSFDDFTVGNNSSVSFHFTPNSLGTTLTFNSVSVDEKSRFDVNSTTSGPLKTVIDNGVNVANSSHFELDVASLSMPLISGGTLSVSDSSRVDVTLLDTSIDNIDTVYGFGCSLGSVYIQDHSAVNLINNNTGLRLHMGKGLRSPAIELKSHSSFTTQGFLQLTTSATDKKFKANLHSSFEINDPIQSDGGATAYTDIELKNYSTFGSPLSGGTLTETLTQSYVYEIE